MSPHEPVADFVTILTHPVLPMAKTWQQDGTIKPYSTAKHFRLQTRSVANLRELSTVLTRLESRSRSCIIRGWYKGEDYARDHNPEHKDGHAVRQLEMFEERPHHWCLIEVDEFVPVVSDPASDTVGAIEEYIAAHLPDCFASRSYHWQLSNSAGSPKHIGRLKVHIWFWLATPYESDRLRAWVRACQINSDPAVCNTVQVHYTAAPIFEEGVVDPVVVRSGFVDHGHDLVDLVIPDDMRMPEKELRRERLQAAISGDRVANILFEKGMVKSYGKDGQLFVECPRSDHHSGESGETTTVYYPANTGGYATGNFKCLHAHCVDEPQGSFIEALGIPAADPDDFDDITDVEVTETPASEALTERFTPIHAAVFAAQRVTTHWLIKEVIPAADLVAVYGASGSGKTFVVLDMVMAIARGVPWRGLRTHKGRVIYVVTEGSVGFRRRLLAYAKHHDISLDDVDIFAIPDSPSLLDKKDCDALIKAIRSIGGARVVVLDTLAQVTAGGNENSGEDMGRALRNAAVIGRALDATVLLVHHTGKDEARGARGWSGIKGALDAELEVVRAEDDRVLAVTKQKDGEEGAEYGFRLLQLPIDQIDEDGNPVTSCAVVEQDASRRQVSRIRDLGPNERLVRDTLMALSIGGDGWADQDEVIRVALDGLPDDEKKRPFQLKRAGKKLQDVGIFLARGNDWKDVTFGEQEK